MLLTCAAVVTPKASLETATLSSIKQNDSVFHYVKSGNMGPIYNKKLHCYPLCIELLNTCIFINTVQSIINAVVFSMNLEDLFSLGTQKKKYSS